MEESGREEKKICKCKNNCPLDGECCTESIVYIAKVSDKNGFKKNTLDVLRFHSERDFILMLCLLGWKIIEITPSGLETQR